MDELINISSKNREARPLPGFFSDAPLSPQDSTPLIGRLDLIRSDWPQALIHHGKYCIIWKGVTWDLERPLDKIQKLHSSPEELKVRRKLVQSGAFIGWTERRGASTYAPDKSSRGLINEMAWEIDRVEFKNPESERDRRWMRHVLYKGMLEYPYKIGELGRGPTETSNWLLSPLGVLKEGHGHLLLAGVAQTKNLHIHKNFVLSTEAPVLPIDIYSALWFYKNFSILRDVYLMTNRTTAEPNEMNQAEAVRCCKTAGRKILERPESYSAEIDALELEMRSRVRKRVPKRVELLKIFDKSAQLQRS